MADQAFAELLDLIRKPQIEGEVLTADIQPVHAGLFDAKGDALLVSAVGPSQARAGRSPQCVTSSVSAGIPAM